MKKITFVGLLSFLMLSGLALAEQTGQEKKASPMQGMMQEMMKGEKTGEGGMGGMMRMMKMMEQCSAMMESMHTGSGEAKEGQKK
jgi:hypothetical protein